VLTRLAQSIESVSLIQFVLATLFVLPRVLVYVFVGSRIASLSDGEQRSHMATCMLSFPVHVADLTFTSLATKIINGLLIVGGIVTSVIASSYDLPLFDLLPANCHQGGLLLHAR
jgi:hypothetical protein